MVIFLFLIWRTILIFSTSLFCNSVVGMILYLLLMPKKEKKKLNSILDEISYESCIIRTDWTSIIIRVSLSRNV